jgi:hypothetical protein
LIEHFRSIGKVVGEQRLRPIFSGAKRAVPKWVDPEEKKIVDEAYNLAEKELFPSSQPQPTNP